MATQRFDLLPSIFLFVAIFFYLQPATTAAAGIDDIATTVTSLHDTAIPAAAPSKGHHPTADSSALKFLREYCGGTLYPDFCYSSLTNYAGTIKEDPNMLVRFALSLSLNKARKLATYIANSGAASSLRDCSSGLDDGQDEIRDSVKQFRRYASGTGADPPKLQISNMQTWMSAALTNVDSCTEGVKGVKDAAVKTKIGDQVTEVTKMISVALAIVNRYANQVNL